MTTVAGRYELLERIGGGGMADVFRARDRSLDRVVALKALRVAHADDEEMRERFHREADALASFTHPNIVRVLDWGTAAEGPFIAMELVEGGTLRDLLAARRRLPPHRAASIAADIADALEAAHRRGVLHRDLKPDNILLEPDGRPKLGDFGIALITAATALTRTGEVLGTPRYLAPEQLTGDVVDERVDVYGLGVILYEMLTGGSPTGGSTASEIVSRRLRLDPVRPRKVVAISRELEAVVLRALARDPARRFARARDLRDALLPHRQPPLAAAEAPRRRRLALGAVLAAAAAALAHLTLRAAEGAARGAGAASATAIVSLQGAREAATSSLPSLPQPRAPSLDRARRVVALAPIAARAAKGAARGAGAVSASAIVSLRAARDAALSSLASLPQPRAPSLDRARRVVALALITAGAGALLASATDVSSAFARGLVTATSAATAASHAPRAAPVPSVAPTPARTVAAAAATPERTAAVTPEPTAATTPEPTAAATPEPTATAAAISAPTAPPSTAPPAVSSARGAPADALATFYQLVSAHDFASASALWSPRMQAAYPPQTNIWGRFDRTRSIVTRSANVTTATSSNAAVAVDVIETMSDGSVRRWVGTWYLVRSGTSWLLDQPQLGPA